MGAASGLAIAGYAISAAGAATGVYSAIQSKQNADKANATAEEGIQAQKDATAAQDKALQDTQNQNLAKQTQDSQWFGMRQQASKMAGLSTQAPGALTGQSGSMAGFMAGTNAGKKLLGQ